MDEHRLASTSRSATDDGALSLVQRVLRVGWWATAVTLTIGLYVALDRVAWVNSLAESNQSGLRIASGAALIALAGLFDPWGREEPRD